MFWCGKPVPKSIRAKIDEIRGKTLYFSNKRLAYVDDHGKDYGRHEIDWLLAHGLVTQTINFGRMVYEFELATYGQCRPYFD